MDEAKRIIIYEEHLATSYDKSVSCSLLSEVKQ